MPDRVNTDTLLPPDLVAAAARVLDANRAAGRCIAVAESCTGGLVAAALTELPGASDVFIGGVVTYANSAKADLGVPSSLIDTFGAVSPATAWAMARSALARSGADVAVAITGVAGPGGGTPDKPVGLVVFARALKGGTPDDIEARTERFDPSGGRAGIRRQAALMALSLLMP